GRLVLDRRSGRPSEILVGQELKPEQGDRVLAHEVGHAIDVLAGRIPSDGQKRQLLKVYNHLNNPSASQHVGKPFTPDAYGYRGKEADRELWAEAIRAYMAD